MTENATAGRYRIQSRIAAGGMGEVYRAIMETADGFGRQVALKLVRQDADDPSFDRLFVEEAHVAMSLSHANVVQSFDVGKLEDRWFLAMEYVDGAHVGSILRSCASRFKQPIPQRHALFIAVEGLKGLDYAHRRKSLDGKPLGIVHRDISPGNLLVSFEGEVKVADFGIAKSTRESDQQDGTVKGKLPYIAPEQLRGESVDRRADLYSMGAVMYEMFTMTRIVKGHQGSAAVPTILRGDYKKPRQVRPEVPEEIERIILRAMAVDPQDRYPNAAAMRQELERYALSQNYLLSSADMSEFLRELLESQEAETGPPPKSGQTTVQPSSAKARVPWSEAVDHDDGESKPPEDPVFDPFDQLLGAELQRVHSTATFNVFTAHVTRDATAALDGAAQQSSPSREANLEADIESDRHALETSMEADALNDPERDRIRRQAKARQALGPVPATNATTPLPIVEPPRRALWPWLGAVLAAGVLSVFVIANGMGEAGSDGTASNDRSTSGSNLRDGGGDSGAGNGSLNSDSMDSSLVDSGLDSGIVDSGLMDSGIVDSGVDAGRRRRLPEPPTTPTGTGYLSVNTEPWSYVTVDGRQIRATPLIRHPLPAGRHVVTLNNPNLGLSARRTVSIQPGANTQLSLELR